MHVVHVCDPLRLSVSQRSGKHPLAACFAWMGQNRLHGSGAMSDATLYRCASLIIARMKISDDMG